MAETLTLTNKYRIDGDRLIIAATGARRPLDVIVEVGLVDAWGQGLDFFSRFLSVRDELQALATFKLQQGLVEPDGSILLRD